MQSLESCDPGRFRLVGQEFVRIYDNSVWSFTFLACLMSCMPCVLVFYVDTYVDLQRNVPYPTKRGILYSLLP